MDTEGFVLGSHCSDVKGEKTGDWHRMVDVKLFRYLTNS